MHLLSLCCADVNVVLKLINKEQQVVADAFMHLYDVRANALERVNRAKLIHGLELAQQDVEKGDSMAALVRQARALPATAIKVPRECWEEAGSITTCYHNPALPISQQLEGATREVWRWGTLVKEGLGEVTGNQHLPYLSGLHLTAPFRWHPRIPLVLVDHVGYNDEDPACDEPYSKVKHGALQSV